MQRPKWRLIRSGHLTGAMNMAVDEAILRSVARGGTPTLRFYGWDPPAISVGYFKTPSGKSIRPHVRASASTWCAARPEGEPSCTTSK